MTTWILECSGCGRNESSEARVGLCPECGQPYLTVYTSEPPSRDALLPRWDMWRYSPVLPLRPAEQPVSLGEGLTPLIELPALASRIGVRRLWIKDEGINPTASFKARGLSAAVTRARGSGATGLVVPTAGNAGAALAAYAVAAGMRVRVVAPASTPRAILDTVRAVGAELELVDGHIGDAGKRSVAIASEPGWFNVATLREPYRVEGNRTLGYELAEQLGWRVPDVVIYPTGGGEGTIGIWRALRDMRSWGWLPADTTMPRMIVAQAAGCAPLVRAFHAGEQHATPWENPVTHASGLRVPGPLGDRLVLQLLRESHGDAEAIDEEDIRNGTATLAAASGIDVCPEGGCAFAVARALAANGRIAADAEVVVYNTGSGASYRT
ncbi:MAG TPA: threonine synthase [Gemmatimonadaceae bacterium]|nr:threonine synthase [Gemmatimonadaceae bacterium]